MAQIDNEIGTAERSASVGCHAQITKGMKVTLPRREVVQLHYSMALVLEVITYYQEYTSFSKVDMEQNNLPLGYQFRLREGEFR